MKMGQYELVFLRGATSLPRDRCGSRSVSWIACRFRLGLAMRRGLRIMFSLAGFALGLSSTYRGSECVRRYWLRAAPTHVN